MPANVTDIWVYLEANPLFWLTATLGAYALADWIAVVFHRAPLANPVAIATALLAVLILATGTDYRTFFDGAQFVHFLLGPATVALAVPLYRNMAIFKRSLLPMGVALICGSLAAIVSATLLAGLFGAPIDVIASLAPKSATTPIAMSVSEATGGIPTLTAALVMATGISGAIIAGPLMNLVRIKNPAARGFAAGLTAHGMGTARAFQVNPLAGAFAGVALGLNGAVTAILVPLVLPWILALFSR